MSLAALQRLLNRLPRSREVLVLLAGCAFPLSFAPFYIWPVAVISIGILLLCLEDASRKSGILRFYLFGLGMYGVGNWWIYHSLHVYGGASPVLAVTMMTLLVSAYALHSALHGFVYMRFFHVKLWGPVLAFPALWVLQEWVRTWLLTGFPWFFIGYTQTDTVLAGYAPLAGVMSVSLMLLTSIGLLYSVCLKRLKLIPGVFSLLLIWGAGTMLRHWNFVYPAGDKLTVSLIQGNVDQSTKWQRDSIVPILKRYRDMTLNELGRDIIIWPEAAVTLLRENAGRYLDEMNEAAHEQGSTIVLGIPDRDPLTGRYYNTAIAIGEGEGIYYKRRLVPFGEYVPLEAWLRGLIRAFDLPMSRNQVGPAEQPALQARAYRLSMSICYEIIYPALVRDAVDNPDLLVTISNDTWFGDSIGPKQHMQMARMRAMEMGRYLLRGTNNGVTAVVDHRGRILARAEPHVQTVLRGEISIMQGKTPYALLGDWPLLGYCLLILVLLFYRKIPT